MIQTGKIKKVVRILLLFGFFLSGAGHLCAQDWENASEGYLDSYEEADDLYLNDKSKSGNDNNQTTEIGAGSMIGINLFSGKSKRPSGNTSAFGSKSGNAGDMDLTDPPPPPTYPDVPVTDDIIYLLLAGFGYGVYKIVRQRKHSRAVFPA